MRISIDRLKEIILEEVNTATQPNIEECGGDMEVVDMGSPEGFEGGDEEFEEGGIEALVAKAMEAIADLASAAGSDMAMAGDHNHDQEEIEIVEDE
jgi:hypothetical protein